jgi:hypothetical protein
MDKLPGEMGSRKANGLNWSLRGFIVQNSLIDLAVAESEGTGYLIMLQSPVFEHDFYYEEVFLPAIDALTPTG